jgi:hypothetical protein
LSSASASSRSPSFPRAAALLRFAPMANCSIPNSTPATGRTSTPSSRRSRNLSEPARIRFSLVGRVEFKSGVKPHSKARFARERIRRWALSLQSAIRNSQSAIRNALTLHYSNTPRRVKGAWWPSRSSKPSSPRKRRGRFDSYTLRQMEFDVRFLMFDLKSARLFPSNFKRQTSSKGVILHVA